MGRRAKNFDYFSELHTLARQRGGELLSPAYLGDWAKLLFRCAEGHEFETAPGKIKQERWCPSCAHENQGRAKRAAAEDDLRRLVAYLGGEILTGPYVNSQTKLRYRCKLGREWDAVPSSVSMGTWCRKCGSASATVKRRQGMQERVRFIVEHRGGKLLSLEAASSAVPLRTLCEYGHEWSALPSTIDAGTWCHSCKEEDCLATVRKRAARHGGRCLSESCCGWDDEVLLECAQGHRWTLPAVRVNSGSWCARCRSVVAHDLELMRATARERGG